MAGIDSQCIEMIPRTRGHMGIWVRADSEDLKKGLSTVKHWHIFTPLPPIIIAYICIASIL